MDPKRKVLVVEDEADVMAYLTALFEDNGFETLTAGDGIAGFNLAKSSRPDLITLDIAMPDQSGIRTYRQIKDDLELRPIPVIIITGIGDSLHTYFKKVPGFSRPEGFMNKPIDPTELIQMARRLLADA